jgi:dipeptidyl aminopeptidase/acylaminoacyl peptidase
LIDEGRNHLLDPTGFDPGCPIRIIQGQRDDDVPWRHALALVDLLSSDDPTLTLVKDGEHRMSRPQDLDLMIREVEALWDRAR